MPRARGRGRKNAVDRLAGTEDDPRYQDGARGGSELATRLRPLLRDAGLAGLTDAQLDHLGRVLAGGLARVQEESLCREHRVTDWVWDATVPEELLCPRAWQDHLSFLVDRGTQERAYCSEPYVLDADALRELVALLDRGWEVRLLGHSSHFPGWTLRVLAWPPQGGGRARRRGRG
jgi:hypothetical protein